MKIFTVLILLMIFISCKIVKTEMPKKDWLFSFKSEACTSCLTGLGVKVEKDNSYWLRYEVLGEHYKQKANVEGKRYIDTINLKAKYFKKTDLEGGKAITNGCLTFFESRYLDSLAKAEYKKYRKGQKLYR